jgi:hypothetical protein
VTKLAELRALKLPPENTRAAAGLALWRGREK